MIKMKGFLQIVLLSFGMFISFSAIEIFLPSSVYEWANLKVIKTKNGDVRQIIKSPTKTLESLEVFATTINQGRKFKVGSNPGGLEELLILKEGKIKLSQSGQDILLNAGTVILFPPGVNRMFENEGATKVTYYTFKWKSPTCHVADSHIKSNQPIIYDWDKIEFKKTAKGGSRSIMRTPTQSLVELEMHTTMLNEGERSHAEHMHPDEEIILVRFGSVEESIKGKPYVLGSGSLIFLAPDDMHGIQNAGKGQCEYYAIRWITEKTVNTNMVK